MGWRPLPPLTAEQIERFAKTVAIGDGDECWHRGDAPQRTRSTVSIGRSSFGAHVIAYMAATGEPSPNGRFEVVHHTCSNGWCINPNHLVKMNRCDHGRLHHEMRPA